MSDSKSSKSGLIALLIKLGPKLLSVFAKMLKFLKFGKVALAGASFASYAYMYTWKFALVLMGMLFVHESGHVWAMRRCGVKTKGFYFIPFFGGAAVADEAFPSRGAESYIAIMGPLWGFGISAACAIVYVITLSPVWAAAASWMALINLFNLLPINPLDGGRIFKSIAFSIHSWLGFLFLAIGMLAAVVITINASMGLFAFLFIVGLLDLAYEFRKRNEKTMPKMNLSGILLSLGGYAGTVYILWLLMYMTRHVPGAEAAMDALK